jgi:hypothetical protein
MRLPIIATVMFSILCGTVAGTRGSACHRSPHRPLFVWAEWPEIEAPEEWALYFQTLLGFVSGNCGNFLIPKIVMRVTHPTWDGLFTVSTASAFYTEFLTKLPAHVQLRLYPYMHTEKAAKRWADYRPHGRPLQSVFEYTNEWNTLLAQEGSPVRITGIVVDGEERHNFEAEQPRVTAYKRTYGIPRFAVAIGFDAHSHRSFYPLADEFYMEMYDFYDVRYDEKPPRLVELHHRDRPHTAMDKLHTKSLFPFIESYRDPRMHFMWSVQAKSKLDCIFPLEGTCGSKDDFGWFTATDFNSFLGLVQEQYPELRGRSHGIFQFNFVPPSWL